MQEYHSLRMLARMAGELGEGAILIIRRSSCDPTPLINPYQVEHSGILQTESWMKFGKLLKDLGVKHATIGGRLLEFTDNSRHQIIRDHWLKLTQEKERASVWS